MELQEVKSIIPRFPKNVELCCKGVSTPLYSDEEFRQRKIVRAVQIFIDTDIGIKFGTFMPYIAIHFTDNKLYLLSTLKPKKLQSSSLRELLRELHS